jgi:murein DD-endopeptidase MepM/ murein hydrolase activator NlpD
MPRLSKITLNILILTGLLMAGFSQALTNDEKIAALQAQIQQLEEQKKQLQGTIADTSARAKTLSAEIQNLKNQIAALQVQIQLTGKKIDQTSVQISNVQENILTTEQKIEYQKTTIGSLLQYLHQRDNETLVGILMKNPTLSDYFEQEEYALAVNNQLVELVDSLKKTSVELDNQKHDLESKKGSLESLKQDLAAQKNLVTAVQTDKNNILKVTKGEEAAYQKMLIDVENKENLFFAQLRELETNIIQGGLYIVHVTADGNLPTKAKGIFQWPETGYHTTQGYGCTTYARCGRAKGPYAGAPHNGLDIAAGFGSTISAMADGIIIANGKNDGWGNWVAIQHPSKYNLVSIYAHMSALSFLQVGTTVKAGQTIGYEGNTGNVTGSHLHLSIYKDFFTYVKEKNGQLYFNYFEGSVNPLNFLL